MAPSKSAVTRSKAGSDNQISLLRAKIIATLRLARLLILVYGLQWLIGATLVAGITSYIFKLNAILAFFASFIVLVFVVLRSIPVKALWRSKYSAACQQLRLFETADQLAYASVENILERVFAGKGCGDLTPDQRLQLTQIQLILIRQGNLKKAIKVIEFLQRESSGDAHEVTLAELFILIGRIREGVSMAEAVLQRLEIEGRQHSPTAVSAILGIIDGAILLRHFEDAEQNLAKLKKILDSDLEHQDKRDELIRADTARPEVDLAMYQYALCKVQVELGLPDARGSIDSTLILAKKEEIRSIVQLLVPELYSLSSRWELANKSYEKAKQIAEQSLREYQENSRYRGAEFHRTQAIKTFAAFHLGEVGGVDEMRDAVEKYSEFIEDPHPVLAELLVWLATMELREGKCDLARNTLERALRIRTELFDRDDLLIKEVKDMLAKLDEQTSG